MTKLTEEQLGFFETFGYLVFPGLLKDDIAWITEEFEAVFRDRGIAHDPSKRTAVLPFIDHRERLCTLIDHPGIKGVLTSLLGDDFNYLGSDGNYYSGDTRWHPDGNHRTSAKWIKMALYLDPVQRDTGCLRVIPGTHRVEAIDNWEARNAWSSEELWGISGAEVPAVALESVPGDVVVFNQNLLHGSFGGSTQRRMVALSFTSHLEAEEDIQDLKDVIAAQARFWCDSLHTDIMRNTGPQSRRRHLQQIADNEGHLPALAAQARLEMAEPARG